MLGRRCPTLKIPAMCVLLLTNLDSSSPLNTHALSISIPTIHLANHCGRGGSLRPALRAHQPSVPEPVGVPMTADIKGSRRGQNIGLSQFQFRACIPQPLIPTEIVTYLSASEYFSFMARRRASTSSLRSFRRAIRTWTRKGGRSMGSRLKRRAFMHMHA